MKKRRINPELFIKKVVKEVDERFQLLGFAITKSKSDEKVLKVVNDIEYYSMVVDMSDATKYQTSLDINKKYHKLFSQINKLKGLEPNILILKDDSIINYLTYILALTLKEVLNDDISLDAIVNMGSEKELFNYFNNL